MPGILPAHCRATLKLMSLTSCTRQHLKAVLLKELLELRVQAMKAQMGQRAMLLKTRLLDQMHQQS